MGEKRQEQVGVSWEELQAHLRELLVQRDELVGQVNACLGAIQVIERLLAQRGVRPEGE